MGVIHSDLLLELEVDHLLEFLLDGGFVALVKAGVRDVLGALVVELTSATTVLEIEGISTLPAELGAASTGLRMSCVWKLIEVHILLLTMVVECVNIFALKLFCVDRAASQHLPGRPVCLVNYYQDVILDFCKP